MDPAPALSYLDQLFAERVLQHTYIKDSGSLKAALSQLMASAREGHLCLPISSFGQAGALLTQEEKRLASFIRIDRGQVYLEKNWTIERIIEEQLRRLTVKRAKGEISTKLPLNEQQKEAVLLCLENGLTLLTGGPGTGKTFTAAAIVESIDPNKDKRILLAAPTGRAADHLSRSIFHACGRTIPSATLHKWLGVGRLPPWPKEGEFLKADLIIVDECSMIDAPLFATLLTAVPQDCALVLMGDPHQLNPVGIGSIFSNLVQSAQFSFGKAFLKRSMRTETLELIDLAERVLKGECPKEITAWPNSEKTFYNLLLKFAEPLLEKGVQERPNPEEIFSQITKCRILNCLRQGPYGANAINAFFLERVQQETKSGTWWWAPIMITSNDERTSLSNGQLGIILERKGQRATAKAFFPHGLELPMIELPAFEWAFCCSVHKSQGSEYEEIVILVPPGSENFGKEMLYTAITRAKRRASIVAGEDILRSMVAKSVVKHSGIL